MFFSLKLGGKKNAMLSLTQEDTRTQRLLKLSISWIAVAFGLPHWFSSLGIVAAGVAYAIYWSVMLSYPERRQRFWLSFTWFGTAQLVQLSFFSAYDFQGYYIFIIWFALSALFAAQFGLMSLFVTRANCSRPKRCLVLAAFWVLMEWSRLIPFTGFPWTSMGLHLAATSYTLQLVSLTGVYGLAFLVVFTNLMVLRAWCLDDQAKPLYQAVAVLLIPYLLGWGQLTVHENSALQESGKVNAVLIQTGRAPRDLVGVHGLSAPEYGYVQWRDALEYLSEQQGKPVDLIAFPEGFAPYSTHEAIYPLELVQQSFLRAFGPQVWQQLPEPDRNYVGNAYWAQALANIFTAQVVVGLDIVDSEGAYNSAVHFVPHTPKMGRYHKRMLLPMAEYMPFTWAQPLAAAYGIYGSFNFGTEPGVFQYEETPAFSIAICSDEAYGEVVREGRRLGAEFLLHISNDGWYPNSRLPRLHFEHARLRAVENGVPMLRACNTGVTGAVDSLGRDVKVFAENGIPHEWKGGALYVELPRYQYHTLYSSFGDGPVLGTCLLLMGFALRRRSLKF